MAGLQTYGHCPICRQPCENVWDPFIPSSSRLGTDSRGQLWIKCIVETCEQVTHLICAVRRRLLLHPGPIVQFPWPPIPQLCKDCSEADTDTEGDGA